jgi:hypothetical protein
VRFGRRCAGARELVGDWSGADERGRREWARRGQCQSGSSASWRRGARAWRCWWRGRCGAERVVQVKHWCGASRGERPGASSGAQGGFRRVSSSAIRAKERTRLGRSQKRCGKDRRRVAGLLREMRERGGIDPDYATVISGGAGVAVSVMQLRCSTKCWPREK